MSDKPISPLGAITRGAIAGAAGTLAMDLLWFWRYRKSGGEDGFLEWEFSTDIESYDEAGAPAQMGKRLVEGVFGVDLEPETAGRMNDLTHWATGSMWGAVHGILAGSTPLRTGLGPATGTLAWLTSYAVLVPAGLYRPMNEYEWNTLWKDWSAHLVFGTVTGFAFSFLGKPSTR